MKNYRLFLLTGMGVLLSGCFSLKNKQEISAVGPNIATQQTLIQQKTQKIKDKKDNASQFPEVLGGVVSSERWIIYKEKEEEEFEGNVSYDNGTYVFRAQYALSQRKKSLITAKHSVYLRKNEPENAYYEIYADKASFNYSTGAGQASANRKKRIKLVYQNSKGDLMTALAERADFNTKQETYVLSGNVFVTYIDNLGKKTTLQADKISARKKDNYALLQGDAVIENQDYTLRSQTIEYDGNQKMAYAYGDRPLANGKTQDGTFAIIADKMSAETDNRKIKLSGLVEGWVVSEQINNSKANETFNVSF